MKKKRVKASGQIPQPIRSVNLDGNDLALISSALHGELDVLNLIERRGGNVSNRRALISALIAKLGV